MIDHQRKILFIHIPKNAGTSIERDLFPSFDFKGAYSKDALYGFDAELGLNLQHATLAQLLGKHLITEHQLQGYTSFAVVRNPFTRAISGYKWLLKDLKTEGTFEEFLTQSGAFSEGRLSEAPHYVADHFLTQSDFIAQAGRIRVDHVLRFEHLKQDFGRLAHSKGWDAHLDNHFKKNRQKRWELARLMTPKIQALIVERYREDFELFDYSTRFNKWKYILGHG